MAEGYIFTIEDGDKDKGLALRTLKSAPVKKEMTFTKQSRLFYEYEEENAKYVEFSCYWPSCAKMQPEQRKWYFYWRGRVRRGEYISTSLSYIFVYIYEIINNVGQKSHSDNLLDMINMWKNYRDKYKTLDAYMKNWLEDYAIVNFPGQDSSMLLKEMLSDDLLEIFPHIAVRTLFEKENINSVFIFQIAEYDVFENGFFKEPDNMSLMLYITPVILKKIDSFLNVKNGKGIVDTFATREKSSITRTAFHTAIYDGGSKIISVPYGAVAKHPMLKKFLLNTLKKIENTLRQHKNHKGKLKVEGLDTDVQRLIENEIKAELEKRKAKERLDRIKIDPTRLQILENETMEVQKRLLTGQETEKEDVYIAEKEEPVNNDAPPSEILFDSDELKVIEAFKASGCMIPENNISKVLGLEFADIIIDAINTKAMEAFGDVLLYSDGENWIMSEEFNEYLI